jgi:hypothetical protein
MRSNQRFISVTSLRRTNCPSSSVTTPNEAKKNLLVFGVGYRYLAGINQAPETRIEIDFTPRFRLPLGIQAGIAAESTYDLLRAATSPGGIEIA